MFYVLIINNKGIPDALFGPDIWDRCIEKVTEIAQNRTTLSPDDIDIINDDGMFTDDNSDWGVYTLCAEEIKI